MSAAVLGRIVTLSELTTVYAQARDDGSHIVLCHGTFDVVHPGHMEHLRQAKALGDILVVGITADRHVTKGPGRPVFNQSHRLSFMANLALVDYVALVDDVTALPIIEAVRPHVYVKGPDYRDRKDGNFAKEQALVESFGGRIHFTDGFTHSSSQIVNEQIESRPEAMDRYLRALLQQYGADDMLAWLDKIVGLRMLIYGEPIIDEYIFVKPRGKTPKDSLVTFEIDGASERFEGGTLIIGKHLLGLGANVDTADYHRIVKRRYVERAFVRKVFSVVEPTDMAQATYPVREPYDLTIAADYGHGLFTSQSDCRRFYGFGNDRPFMALTVQSNSLNWGYNRLTKWPQADYAVVDREELRLACGHEDWDGYNMEWWAEHERRRLSASVLAVTLGHEGCLIIDATGQTTAPALATRIVDRMGAGDAFLAITAPLAYLKAPKEVIAFLGSVAAGIKVGMLGNQPIEKGVMRRWIKSMLA